MLRELGVDSLDDVPNALSCEVSDIGNLTIGPRGWHAPIERGDESGADSSLGLGQVHFPDAWLFERQHLEPLRLTTAHSNDMEIAEWPGDTRVDLDPLAGERALHAGKDVMRALGHSPFLTRNRDEGEGPTGRSLSKVFDPESPVPGDATPNRGDSAVVRQAADGDLATLGPPKEHGLGVPHLQLTLTTFREVPGDPRNYGIHPASITAGDLAFGRRWSHGP